MFKNLKITDKELRFIKTSNLFIVITFTNKFFKKLNHKILTFLATMTYWTKFFLIIQRY